MRTLSVIAVLVGLSVFAPAASAEWAPAQDVAPLGGAASGHSSAIAGAPAGRFVVAWTAAVGTATTDTRVVAQRLGNGRTGRRLTLASGGGTVNDVRLWPGPRGRTVATWATPIGPFDVPIVVRTIGRDDRLGPPVTVTEPGDGGLAVTAVPRRDGSVTVAWIAQTATEGSVVKARRISAAGTAGPVSVVSPPGDVVDELVGAADIDDGAMLVWNDRGILHGRRVTAAGVPARPTFQISGLGQTATAPQLATDGTGGATAVWVQGTDPVSVQEVAIISDDKLSGLEQLSQAGVPSLAPSLAFRGLAGVVVWDARTAAGAVVASVDADGRRATLSVPSTATASLRPQAGIDRVGNGYAVWQRAGAVQAALFGGRIGAARVTTLARASAAAQSPHLAVGPGGRAMAIWTIAATSGSGPTLQAAEYRPPRARAPRRP